jgi:hypothetical protein
VVYNAGQCIDVYCGYKIVSVQKELMGTASVIKEMSGRRTSVINSTH